jgi:predicted nucleic acid-binding protein
VLVAIRSAIARSEIDRQRALEALWDYRDRPITWHDQLDLLTRVFGLRDNFTASDAMHVALAELFDATMLTGDRRLARAVLTHTRLAVEEI